MYYGNVLHFIVILCLEYVEISKVVFICFEVFEILIIHSTSASTESVADRPSSVFYSYFPISRNITPLLRVTLSPEFFADFLLLPVITLGTRNQNQGLVLLFSNIDININILRPPRDFIHKVESPRIVIFSTAGIYHLVF